MTTPLTREEFGMLVVGYAASLGVDGPGDAASTLAFERAVAAYDALRARLAEAEAAWRVPHFRGHPMNPRDGENEIGSVIVTTAWYERLRALLAPERPA